jgi:hypothetical protein
VKKSVRVLVLLSMLSFFMFTSCKGDAEPKNVTNETSISKASSNNLPKELEEEDCDDKAKKLEKELPQEINLQGGGDAGCSLDEINGGAHP